MRRRNVNFHTTEHLMPVFFRLSTVNQVALHSTPKKLPKHKGDVTILPTPINNFLRSLGIFLNHPNMVSVSIQPLHAT